VSCIHCGGSDGLFIFSGIHMSLTVSVYWISERTASGCLLSRISIVMTSVMACFHNWYTKFQEDTVEEGRLESLQTLSFASQTSSRCGSMREARVRLRYISPSLTLRGGHLEPTYVPSRSQVTFIISPTRCWPRMSRHCHI
jgi:hypothetical protein